VGTFERIINDCCAIKYLGLGSDLLISQLQMSPLDLTTQALPGSSVFRSYITIFNYIIASISNNIIRLLSSFFGDAWLLTIKNRKVHPIG
jgi:hypothetical protein